MNTTQLFIVSLLITTTAGNVSFFSVQLLKLACWYQKLSLVCRLISDHANLKQVHCTRTLSVSKADIVTFMSMTFMYMEV